MTVVTVTLWLLLDMGNAHMPTVVIDRFATEQECMRVAKVLDSRSRWTSPFCVQATVAR